MQQHGDVLILRVDSVPQGAKKVEPTNGRLILAEGEATGHAHAVSVADGVELYEKDGTLYLRNDVEATLTHEEHDTQTIAPGTYEVGGVVEVDPFEGEIRRVAD